MCDTRAARIQNRGRVEDFISQALGPTIANCKPSLPRDLRKRGGPSAIQNLCESVMLLGPPKIERRAIVAKDYRIVMLLADEPNIREVIVFPMTQKAEDLMMNAPAPVSDKQLKELGIRVVDGPKG